MGHARAHAAGSGPEAKITVKFAAGEKTLLAKFLKRATGSGP